MKLKQVLYHQEFTDGVTKDIWHLVNYADAKLNTKLIDGIKCAQIQNRHGTKTWVDWEGNVEVLEK